MNTNKPTENEALRAAHVQNPAEIEHAAGDVSKNRAEVNTSQQPAPATQQAGAAKENLRLVRVIADKIEDGTLFQSGIYSKKDLARFVRNVADAAAPQPSPTAQADSQPGDKDLVAVPRDLIGAACSAIDKKRDGARTLAELRRYTVGDLSAAITSAPQADSQPAMTPETVYAAIAHGDQDHRAWLLSALRAVWCGEAVPPVASPIADAAAESQPEPARAPAQSVLEDAARWQWLADYLIGERTDLDEGIVACATIDDLRQFADAARKQGANHD